MTRGIHAPPQPPLTPDQQKILDAFVLEAFALDPVREAGSVAADATLENLIPGRAIIFQDVMDSKTRQAIVRQYETPVFPQTIRPSRKGDSHMIRRSEEEKEKLLEFCIEHREECTAIELTDLINKEKVVAEPVNISYVRYLLKNAPKAPKNRAGKATGAKRGRPAGVSINAREGAEKSDSEEGIKFDGSKLKWRLVWWGFLEAIVRVLMWGAKTYAPDNWKSVADRRERYKEALMRHSIAYAKGEITDKDTQESHLACIGCNAMFLHWMDQNGDPGK